MTATPALTTDLKDQVKLLADDLRKRLDDDPARLADWQRTHREAVTKDRTAMSWVDWREDRIDQAAVAWVLTTVFIRFCEDNCLVKPVWFSGPTHRRQEALDGYNAYFRANPVHSDREWLESVIAYLRSLPATRALVDAHSALEYISPSGDSITRLREFWLRRGDDGALIHYLHDESLSTRFLGDLYQDLSDYAKDKYALLQTPVFVEEHILDRTLEPALNDRPLDGFRMIDPTCGSGHFLLGAFDRLLNRWHKHAPGMEIQARVQAALDAIHGVDLNPFAVAIARFRLTVAALKACDLQSLEDAPAFKVHLATGDSLIHGPDPNTLPGMTDRSSFMPFHYTTEDGPLLLEILDEGRYDTVVGNPPYITAKDKGLNKIYRSKFGKICKGTYALTVPFMVEFFALAKRGGQSGWVGMITSNSFSDHQFGKSLIEDFLAHRDICLVEDTSGAYIPGHGTPTVIIVARNRAPLSNKVRVLLGVRGEVGRPVDPSKGKVWSSIIDHIDEPNWTDDWIIVTDLERKILASFPWILSVGSEAAIRERMEQGKLKLRDRTRSIGYTGQTNSDEVFLGTAEIFKRRGLSVDDFRPFVTGGDVRDYQAIPLEAAIFPYADGDLQSLATGAPIFKWFWPYRTSLGARATFNGSTYAQEGRPWWSWHQVAKSRLSGHAITWALIQTHNHFAFLRDCLLHNRHAPIAQLHGSASEDDYIAICGVLNSSAACFWLKQVCPNRGGSLSGDGARVTLASWENFYDFNGTLIESFPLPDQMQTKWSQELNRTACELASLSLPAVCSSGTPSRDLLRSSEQKSRALRCQMISLQEELDWEIYRLYGLIEEDLTYSMDDLPAISLGERAFEISLARGGEQSAWFERHDSEPSAGIPVHWPDLYKELVQRRLELITTHPYIKLLEKPEYKRRWSQEPWEKRQERTLRNWLLDRLEDRQLWFDSQGRPSPRSVAQLADDVTRDGN
jgi:hypothetical protein